MLLMSDVNYRDSFNNIVFNSMKQEPCKMALSIEESREYYFYVFILMQFNKKLFSIAVSDFY